MRLCSLAGLCAAKRREIVDPHREPEHAWCNARSLDRQLALNSALV